MASKKQTEISWRTTKPVLLLLRFHRQNVHCGVFFLQIPRMVKVIEESSPYFKVISPKDTGHKIAPGVPSVFRILFTPEENKVRNWLNTCH